MNAPSTMAADDRLQGLDGLERAGPTLVLFVLLVGTAYGALMAAVAASGHSWPAGWLRAALHWQCGVLAVAGGSLAGAAHRRLIVWEGRAAPRQARERIRAGLQRWLAGTMAVGAGGVLALAAVQAWQTRDALPLLAGAALLAASGTAGLCLVQGWQGRLPRGLMWSAAALLAGLVLMPGSVDAVMGDAWLAGALGGLTLACLWRAVYAPQTLAPCARAMPRWRTPAAWRGALLLQDCELVPEMSAYRTWTGEWTRRSGRLSAITTIFLIVTQSFGQSRYLPQLFGWGHACDGLWEALGLGVLLFLGAAYSRGMEIGPALHWRRRLAPQGLTARRWAQRMVWGSLLAFALGLSLTVALATASTAWFMGRAFVPSAVLSVFGEAWLASSLMLWVRGRHSREAAALSVLLGACLTWVSVLLALQWLGLPATRGPLWLGLELVLGAVLARAAVHAWARRDLNAMA